MKYDENVQVALNKMDTDLLEHCMSVRQLTHRVCKNIVMDLEVIEKAAVLHDIGKIYITPTILNKPDSLTQIEREIVDLHAYYSYRILKEMEFNEVICQTVLLHHGRDKPCLTPKPDILPEAAYYAEILRTIDAYDALTSDRPYREKYSQKKAVQILREEGYSPEILLVTMEKILF